MSFGAIHYSQEICGYTKRNVMNSWQYESEYFVLQMMLYA